LTISTKSFAKAQTKKAQESKYNVILDVFAGDGSDDKLHQLGDDMGIDACANMQVVSATDVVAFGFWKKSNGKSLCMAFNPCSHTYAFAQVGILPSIPLSKAAPEMSVTIDVVAFSLEKQLQSTSLNKLWEGGSASPAEKQVPGHVFIQGTLSVALQLKDDLSLALEVVCKLIMDMDPGNDGAFSPFAEGSNRQTDWAFMLSGDAKPVLHLPNDKTLDLSGFLSATADMYVLVNGEDSAFQFGATISRNLGKLCDTSPALDILCAIFEEETGLSGSLLMYANDAGFGLRVEVTATFELKSDFLEDMLNFPGGSVSAGFQLSFIGKKPEVCVSFSGKNVCFGSCSSNSDCADDKFCDTVFKVCSKKRKIGGKCGQNAACTSEHCVLGFCRECEAQGDCTGSDQYCTDKLSLNGASKCENQRDDGWGICTRDYQCKHYCKGGWCRECEDNDHCSSGKYCTDAGSCKTPNDNGFGICTKDYQCKNVCKSGWCKDCKENGDCGSGRYCNDRSECKSKRSNGWRTCSKGSQCASGRCSWGKCKSR